MDPNSSLGKNFLGENVVEISNDNVEGSRDWDSPEYQDTANSGGKKEKKSMVFDKMDTEEVSDRFVAPCFVNGLEAYDGEIIIEVEENMISNELAVKLCLEHEVKRGNKMVKKELIVALRGELYFVKFIINPEKDDVEPEVIFGRSFLRMTKAITDFRARTITIYPALDLFLEDIKEEEKSLDDWDHLLDFILMICHRTSSSADGHLTQEEAVKEALAIRISQNFTLLEEVRPLLETMAYHDKHKKVLYDIWKDKVELDGMIVKEEEEAIKRLKVNENALADTELDINTMPCRIYEQLGREEMKKVDRGITMINHTHAEAMDIPIDRDARIVVGRGFLYTIGGIVNTPERHFSTFNGFCHQTFRAARSNVLRTTKSDSDDEEEYEIKKNKFGASIYGPEPAPYMDCNNPTGSLALQAVINPFQKISVWKEAVSFLGSLPVPLKHVNWKPDYKGCYTKEEEATGQWRTKVRLTDPYGNIYMQAPQEETIIKLDHQDPNALDNLKPWKKCCSHKFIINSCYRKVAVERRSLGCDGAIDDMLMIKLREAGSNEEIFTFQNRYTNLAWLILRWMKRKGAGSQKESQICCGQFIMKLALKLRVLTDEVIRSLSSPIYCRDLDTTTLRELIDSEGRLILEDRHPGLPRVGIPRPSRASMQDLYDSMGSIEIRQQAIKRMEYMQSYHWDMYQGVSEHMVGTCTRECLSTWLGYKEDGV
nr:hypothetical protein [Tanacetum cinerariifolium]